jgi:hypothetical protein
VPDVRAPGLTGAWLYGRGVALAARGRIAEAHTALTQLQDLAARTPEGALAGFNTLRGVLAVAQPVVAARIAASEHHDADAVRLLQQAVAAEDALAYNEPADWYFPTRHLLGARTSSTTRTTAGPCTGWPWRSSARARPRRRRARGARRRQPGRTRTCSCRARRSGSPAPTPRPASVSAKR